jgi:hypothetical protein
MVLLQYPFQFVLEYHELTSCAFFLGVDELPISQLTQRSYSTKNTSVVPILTYNNSDLEKLKILKENKGKAGVYR